MTVKSIDISASRAKNAGSHFALDTHSGSKVNSPPRKAMHMKPVDPNGKHECQAEQGVQADDPRVETYAREVDAVLTKGNVMLHRGLVAREEEVDRLRKRVLKMRF
jgi:hypothetical protein